MTTSQARSWAYRWGEDGLGGISDDQQMTLYQVAAEIGNRLAHIFLRDDEGRRPVFGGAAKFQTDPHWRDHLMFYEYFHGDSSS